MAKHKITKLGDAANPYTKRKVTKEQARQSAKDSARTTPKAKPKAAPAKKSESMSDRVKKGADEFMKSMNQKYGGGAYKRRLDKKIQEQGG